MQTSWSYIRDFEDFIDRMKENRKSPLGLLSGNCRCSQSLSKHTTQRGDFSIKKKTFLKIGTNDLVKIAEFILKNNFFEFNKEIKQQIFDTAIGTKFAAPYEKSLVMENYVTNFQQLPLNLVYSLDDPDDQVAMLNKLITDCNKIHSPLKRVKLTRPVAPWMHHSQIIELRKELASQRESYRNHETSINSKNCLNTRTSFKKL